MALQTKTFSIGDFAWKSWSNGYVLDLVIAEESTDLAANSSVIKYTLQLRSGPNNRFAGYLGASVTIGGKEVEKVSSIGLDAYYNHTYTLLTGITTVNHNSDGTLELAVKGNIWQASSNSYAPPSMEVSGTVALTEIPRVSQVTVSPSPVAVGGKLTIKTNRKSDGFTHKIAYAFGDLQAQIAENVENEFVWTVPEELAGQIPAETTGWGSITCYTYSGGSLVGTAVTDLVVTVPQNDSTKPQLDPVATPVTGISNFEDLYIQGISKISVNMNAQGYHTDIAEATITVQGMTYSGPDLLESGVLLQPGSFELVCKVTDQRGFPNSATEMITVEAYQKPGVTALDGLDRVIVCRSDSAGNPDINGNRVLVKAKVAFYSVNGRNSGSLLFWVRPENGAWSETPVEFDGQISGDGSYVGLLSGEYDTKRTWQIRIEAYDAITAEPTALFMPIGTASTPLHLGRGGRNVALGRYCDYGHQDAVDIGWDIYADGHFNGIYFGSAEGAVRLRCSGQQVIMITGQQGYGIAKVAESGAVAWEGASGIGATADGDMTITISGFTGRTMILSTGQFEIMGG